MKEEKQDFIENELKELLMKIDNKISDVKAIPNIRGDDITHVYIIRSENFCDIQKINIECDSLAAIVKDVIKAIK